eukprot:gene39543-52150_t
MKDSKVVHLLLDKSISSSDEEHLDKCEESGSTSPEIFNKHLSLLRLKNNSLLVVQKSLSGASLPEFARQLELYEGPANRKLSSTTVDGKEEEEEEEAAALHKKRLAEYIIRERQQRKLFKAPPPEVIPSEKFHFISPDTMPTRLPGEDFQMDFSKRRSLFTSNRVSRNSERSDNGSYGRVYIVPDSAVQKSLSGASLPEFAR